MILLTPLNIITLKRNKNKKRLKWNNFLFTQNIQNNEPTEFCNHDCADDAMC